MPRKHRPRIAESLLAAAFALLMTAAHAADDRWKLSAAEWSRPRSGVTVMEMAPVANAVRAWQAEHRKHDSARLLLVHPGGEEGSLWASELRDWLIALGLPPQAVELAPGSRSADLEIRLET